MFVGKIFLVEEPHIKRIKGNFQLSRFYIIMPGN